MNATERANQRNAVLAGFLGWTLSSVPRHALHPVMWWAAEDRAISRARWALQLQGLDLPTTDEPFAAIILATADPEKVDKRTRSKWSRVLRYTMEHKTNAEPLAAFIRRKGGINKCAERFTRCLRRLRQPTR